MFEFGEYISLFISSQEETCAAQGVSEADAVSRRADDANGSGSEECGLMQEGKSREKEE